MPLTAEKEPKPIGLPQVLSAPRKLLNDAAWAELIDLSQQLNFVLEAPASGFDAGVHLVKELGKGVDQAFWLKDAKAIDWLAGRNMRIFSLLVSRYVSMSLRRSRPMREFRAGAFGRTASYSRCPVPEDWLQQVAALYGKASPKELQGLCAEFFADQEGAPAEAV